MEVKICVVDLGLSNIGSISSCFARLGLNVEVIGFAHDIESLDVFTHYILPGVGTFSEGMKEILNRGWDQILRDECFVRGKPLLGICLGMQLLSDAGEEGGKGSLVPGLGFVKGVVKRMEPDNGLVLPHIGWNSVTFENSQFHHFDNDYYFVHSYSLTDVDPSQVSCNAAYGQTVVAGVRYKNIVGYQFHPEKSQKPGMALVRDFIGGIYA